METVGIRDLKANLSRHLKRVRTGARLAVTERGRIIATLSPVEAPRDLAWAHQLVANGQARWNGAKVRPPERRPKPKRRTASSVVLDERR
jgi:prevent-host-death family protein